MNQFIPTFTDISDWDLRVFQNTTGSRSKKIAIHPETNVEYFFKGSKELETGEIRYPTEFWSEIVSSKIGQILGFNMLDYNIAHSNNPRVRQKIGCLSESMVKHNENKLTEGKVFLTGFDSKYNPETDKDKYTFQFISKTLNSFNIQNHSENLLEIIVFDAIVGNSDRHQENWGIITSFKETIEAVEKEIKKPEKNIIEKILLKTFHYIIKTLKQNHQDYPEKQTKLSVLKNETTFLKTSFSPIYDSGCCLGRELTDDQVLKMNNDIQMLNSYVNRGASEIHWQGFETKRKHFELIELLRKDYNSIIEGIIERVQMNFNQELIRETIFNIDKNLPDHLAEYRLTDIRKELMVKLITLRTEKLLA